MGQSPTWGRPAPHVHLKYILGGCKVTKNLRGQHPVGAETKFILPKKVLLGWSTWACITFWFVDQSSPNLFRLIGDEM